MSMVNVGVVSILGNGQSATVRSNYVAHCLRYPTKHLAHFHQTKDIFAWQAAVDALRELRGK